MLISFAWIMTSSWLMNWSCWVAARAPTTCTRKFLKFVNLRRQRGHTVNFIEYIVGEATFSSQECLLFCKIYNFHSPGRKSNIFASIVLCLIIWRGTKHTMQYSFWIHIWCTCWSSVTRCMLGLPWWNKNAIDSLDQLRSMLDAWFFLVVGGIVQQYITISVNTLHNRSDNSNIASCFNRTHVLLYLLKDITTYCNLWTKF